MEAIVDPTIKAISEPIFNDLAEALSASGYNLSFGRPTVGSGKKEFQKCKEFNSAPHLPKAVSKKTKLLVVWWSRITHKILKNHNIPAILLYKGFLPDTWLLDVGLSGESMLKDMFPDALEDCLGNSCQEWAEKYSNYIVKQNKSKRSQPDLRPDLPQEFVFLPMQYTEDVSVKEHCPIAYDVFFKKVAQFCVSENLPLVIKHHPDIARFLVRRNSDVKLPKPRKWRKAERTKLHHLLDHCRGLGCDIVVSDGSIHWFCKNCTFMAGMNTVAHIDAIMNQSVSFHTGGSIFMNSKAVIHDIHMERGLRKCLNISVKEREELIMYQNAMLYYMYNRYSIIKPENDHFSSEWSNVQKVKNIILKIK